QRNLPPEQLKTWIATTYESVITRTAALPAVDAVASVNDLPLSGFYWLNEFTIEHRVTRNGDDTSQAVDRYVSPSYFAALEIPLLDGRYLAPTDRVAQPGVAVVNTAFVRKYLAGET